MSGLLPSNYAGGDAVFSDDRRFRYCLTRVWKRSAGVAKCGGYGRRLLWIMLNPSSAGADEDDPTIRRCVGFTKRHGYDGMDVVNLYPYIATRPERLWEASDRIDITGGSVGWDWLNRMLNWRSEAVIAAWGSNAPTHRERLICELARAKGARLLCLGRTRLGKPIHPLYVPGKKPMEPYLGPAHESATAVGYE